MIIAICPICGSDVEHFYDADGNIIVDAAGVSLWACEYPWHHPTPEPASSDGAD